jgi:O-acetyl-ADP-ribose deacetylase (regulator of RNase III)
VIKGDITRENVDAVVNPANSYGLMGGGVALAIKKAGGDTIEDEAVDAAPIPVGMAILTTGGLLKARHVIHAPTMTEPAEETDLENVRGAVRAALRCAVENQFSSVAFPGMGTGVGGIGKGEAARAMLEEMRFFLQKDNSLSEIRLIGFDDGLYTAFVKWTKRLSLGTG